jgi:uncharacterized membrane protein (DUF485 family)
MEKSANIFIGRDANGAEIKIDAEEFNNVVKQQIEILLQTQIGELITQVGDLKKSIEELKKNKCKEKRCFLTKIPSWFWILLTSVVGAIIFIGAMILFQRWLGFEASYENSTTIVLGFVGIAATFIVVSNYAQVKEIERKFDEKAETLKSEIEEEFNKQIKTKQREIQANVLSMSGAILCESNSFAFAFDSFLVALDLYTELEFISKADFQLDGIIRLIQNQDVSSTLNNKYSSQRIYENRKCLDLALNNNILKSKAQIVADFIAGLNPIN